MSDLRIAPGFALPLDVAGEALGLIATRGAGKSYASAVLVEELYRAGVQTIVLDPTGVYWGLRGAGEKEGLPLYVFGGPHGDVPLEATAGALFADLAVDDEQSFVLDLSAFDTKAEQTRFVTAFAERLYRRKAQNRTTLHLVIDEADEFAPQRPMRDEPRMLGAMESIVRRGRSRGLGTTLITQRSASLNKNVLDLIDTLIVMRVTGPRDRKVVADWVTDKDLRDELGVLEGLPKLTTGTGWVWSPVRGILEKVSIRKLRTFNSYETPKPGEARAEPKEIAPIDLDSLGEKIRATAEKAKADDPRELRKQIATLRAELAKRPPTEEVVREVLVEVPTPVFNGEIERLEEMAGNLPAVVDGLSRAVDVLQVTIREAKGAAVASTVATRPDPPAERTPRPARAQPRPRREERPARDMPADGSVSSAGQRILDTLAWLEDVGFPQPSKLQTGLLAGYRVTKKLGGTYSTELANLKADGFIEYPTPGLMAMTLAGSAIASPTAIEKSTEGLQRVVLSRLDSAERRVLDELIAVYPESLGKVELGTRAGYTVTAKLGGTFSTVLAKLKSLGLIVYPAPGRAQASDLLFLE